VRAQDDTVVECAIEVCVGDAGTEPLGERPLRRVVVLRLQPAEPADHIGGVGERGRLRAAKANGAGAAVGQLEPLQRHRCPPAD
jgi:hypothetical protein